MNKIILQSFFISGCLHLIALVFCDVILCTYLVPYKYEVYDYGMRKLLFFLLVSLKYSFLRYA